MYDKREWQELLPNAWFFGAKERGIVRMNCAEVYCDIQGGWAWVIKGDHGKDYSGKEETFMMAIDAVERELGIK